MFLIYLQWILNLGKSFLRTALATCRNTVWNSHWFLVSCSNTWSWWRKICWMRKTTRYYKSSFSQVYFYLCCVYSWLSDAACKKGWKMGANGFFFYLWAINKIMSKLSLFFLSIIFILCMCVFSCLCLNYVHAAA